MSPSWAPQHHGSRLAWSRHKAWSCGLSWVVLGVLSCHGGATSAPRIDSIEPNRVVHGSSVQATIVGANFQTGLDVRVDSRQAAKVDRVFAVWLGSIRVATSAVEYVGPTQLTIGVPPTLAVEAYDVKVTTPAGRSATLPDGLIVVDSAAAPSGSAAGGSASARGASGYTGGYGADASGGSLPETETGGTSDASTGSGGSGLGGASASPDAGEPVSGGTTGSAGSELAGAGQTMTLDAAGSGGSAGSDATGTAAAAAGSDGAPDGLHTTLWTDGRLLKDTCGQVVTLRGVQQKLLAGVPSDGDWTGLMDQIAATGANAVRIIPDVAVLTLADLDAVMAKLHGYGIIAILAGPSFGWLNDNHAMLAKYSDRLILDVWLPSYDDRARFVRDGQAAVETVRSYGYTEPLVVSSNDNARDLPALLQYGETLVAADPGHNLMFGWYAYWGSSNLYQNRYGMSLSEGVSNAAAATFPIVMGLTQYTEGMLREDIEYADAVTQAQTHGMSWVWSTWYNPPSAINALSSDGTLNALTAAGAEVVTEHAAGIAKTSVLACQEP
ncbi:MAG: hypothetical protein JW940_00205 [Polyangiaceae bacterium]|nr:hypothetical protein [Polyangiaceae bacterium]